MKVDQTRFDLRTNLSEAKCLTALPKRCLFTSDMSLPYSTTVELMLKDHSVGHKNLVSQHRRP